MPNRPQVDRPVKLNLGLPESEKAELDLMLWSSVEGRVPSGAYKRFFRERIYEYRHWIALDLAPYGFLPGSFVKGPGETIRRLQSILETQGTSPTTTEKEPANGLPANP